MPQPISRYKGTKVVGFVLVAATFLLFTSISTIQRIDNFPGSSPTVEKIAAASTAIDSPSSNLTSSFLFSKDDIDFKPTTQLSEQKCDPISGQPRKKVPSFQDYEHLRNLTELTTIHGESDTPLAICKFNEQEEGVNHFPHVMQHLYMCYTFWQDNPSRIPVLYIKRPRAKQKMIQKISNSPFLKGFVELLTSQLKVKIFTYGQIIDWLKTNTTTFDVFDSSKEEIASTTFPGLSISSDLEDESLDISVDIETDRIRARSDATNFTFHEMQSPIGYVLSHVGLLNKMAEQHFDLDEGERRQDTVDYREDAIRCSSPRIGILNRKPSSGRSITNAESLVRNITSELFGWSDIVPSSSSPVSLAYFEGLAFKQQVQFFHDTDLLISPHGAQLTGIPFLAGKPCAKMIEFFPHNYLVPDYFGTLAVDSGIEYSYIYVSRSPGNFLGQARSRSGRISPGTTDQRSAARKQNFCIDPTSVVETLREAIRDWCMCTDSFQ